MYSLISSLALISLMLFVDVKDMAQNKSNAEVVEIQDDFTGSFLMEVTEMKNGKPAKNKSFQVQYHIDKNRVAMIPKMENDQTPIMIYNLEDKTMLTLMDQGGNKIGMKMKMPKVEAYEDEVEKWNFEIAPTNETKDIDGYKCKKYLISSDDNSGYVWVTEDVDIDYDKIFNFMDLDKKKKNSRLSNFDDLNGMALEAYTEDKKKNEAFEMKIKNLVIGKVDQSIFDVSAYSITDMTSMGGFGGQD